MISMRGVMLLNTDTHNFVTFYISTLEILLLTYLQLDTSDTSSHKLVFVLLSALSYITSKCHVIKHIENFSGDFTFLASWPSGRARGRARTKMYVGPRPYLVYS